MKTWKKITSMLLTFSLVGGFAACGDKDKDDAPNYSAAAKTYVNTLTQTVEEAKSVKIDLVIQIDAIQNYYGDDGATFDSTLKEVEGNKAVAEIILTESNGSLAASLKATNYEMNDAGEYKAVEISETIVKEGFQYTRSYDVGEEENAYWRREVIEMSLEGLTGIPTETWQALLGADELGEVKTSIADLFAEKMEKKLDQQGGLQNGAVQWNVDYAMTAQDILAYWNSVDESVVKLGDFVNTLTSKAGKPINYDTVVNNLSAFSGKKVSEAIDILDNYAQENYGKSLQQLKDTFVETEFAEVLFGDLLQMNAEAIAAVKEVKIADLKTQAGDLTVAELINQLLIATGSVPTPEEGAEPVDYCAQALQMLAQMKDQTLESMEIELPEIPLSKVNEISLGGGVTFDGDRLSSLNASFGLDVEVPMTRENSETGEVTVFGMGNAIVDVQLLVSDFSTVATVINVPSAEEIQEAYLKDASGWISLSAVEGYFKGYYEVPLPADLEAGVTEMGYSYWVNYKLATNETVKFGEPITVVVTDAGAWNAYSMDYASAINAYVEAGLYTFEVTVNADKSGYTVSGIPEEEEILAWYNAR